MKYSGHGVRVPIPRDGNCLFYSVLYNARVQCENKLRTRAGTQHKWDLHPLIARVTAILKHLVVKEWLENAWYKSFLAYEDQFDLQVEAFKEDGHFTPNIGDLVITAISNVLKTSIVCYSHLI